jgi:hypothetical protein
MVVLRFFSFSSSFFTNHQITAQSPDMTRAWFGASSSSVSAGSGGGSELLYLLLSLHNTSRNDSLRVTCASAISHLMRRLPPLVNNFLDKVNCALL